MTGPRAHPERRLATARGHLDAGGPATGAESAAAPEPVPTGREAALQTLAKATQTAWHTLRVCSAVLTGRPTAWTEAVPTGGARKQAAGQDSGAAARAAATRAKRRAGTRPVAATW